jgi:protein-S-isoprenylcysteine O-methyltransferase Ste14
MSDAGARIKRLFRLRFAVLYPLGIYLAVFAVPDDTFTPWGLMIMAAGMGMRLWSNGYAIKMDKLTTAGPYAFVRNPLYVGTALIVLGAMVMFKLFITGTIFFVFVALAYTRTIRSEEKMLAEKFGAAYLDYRAKVPAMWPALRPYTAGEKWPFSGGRLWFSREHKVALWVGILAIGFHVKKEFMTDGVRWDAKIMGYAAAAALLLAIDLTGEYFRSRQKKMREQ